MSKNKTSDKEKTLDFIREQYKKGIISYRDLLEIDRNYFDVAMWQVGDITSFMENLKGEDIRKINSLYESPEIFAREVINYMENNFNASIGINWSVIEFSCLEVLNQS